jgi:pre-mRNA-splicing factor 38B
MSGNARGPSTAFCSLYRLFQLKPTRRQVRTLLESEEAPHVRAVRATSAAAARGRAA